jgi:hypothetical protein
MDLLNSATALPPSPGTSEWRSYGGTDCLPMVGGHTKADSVLFEGLQTTLAPGKSMIGDQHTLNLYPDDLKVLPDSDEANDSSKHSEYNRPDEFCCHDVELACHSSLACRG